MGLLRNSAPRGPFSSTDPGSGHRLRHRGILLRHHPAAADACGSLVRAPSGRTGQTGAQRAPSRAAASRAGLLSGRPAVGPARRAPSARRRGRQRRGPQRCPRSRPACAGGGGSVERRASAWRWANSEGRASLIEGRAADVLVESVPPGGAARPVRNHGPFTEQRAARALQLY